MEKGIENLQERAEKYTPTFFTELWNWIFTVYYTQLTIACGSNHSVQISSVTLSCPTLCSPMDCSKLDFPVHHQLLQFTQTHVHRVSDGIQPSHPVIPFSSHLQSFPASGSFQISQLFASGVQSIGVSASTSVLPMNTQDWSPLGQTAWISLQSKGLSRDFSNTTVQKR